MRPVQPQPISFDAPTLECCPSPPYTLTFGPEDSIDAMVQFGPCIEAVEQVTNPDFQSTSPPAGGPIANWTTVQGTALNNGLDAVLFASTIIRQTLTIAPNALFRLQIALPPNNTVAAQISIGSIQFTTPPTGGNFEFYFVSNGTQLNISNPSQIVSDLLFIDSISIVQMVVPTMVVRNVENNQTIPSSIAVELDRDRAIYRVSPTAEMIAAGCFRLRITQGCTPANVLLSQIIRVRQDVSCTIALTACGDYEDWAGTSFQPTIRIEGKLRPESYEPEVRRYRNSAGRYRIPYGHQRKVYNLYLDRSPETVRDYFAALSFAESVLIDEGNGRSGVYVAYDNPESVTFSEGDDLLASMQMQMIEKESKIMAVNTSDCTPTAGPVALGIVASQTAIAADAPNTLISAQ